MLVLTIPGREFWDERKEEFFFTKETTLRLEHSLISVSKWEAKWCIPFFETEKTVEQTLDYIRCMTLNQDVSPTVYERLTPVEIVKIKDYIDAPMTATKVTTPKSNKHHAKEYISSELIYYWMISYNIPVEFEKWHINRLITLIRVCDAKAKEAEGKSGTRKTNLASHRERNLANRAKYAKKGKPS